MRAIKKVVLMGAIIGFTSVSFAQQQTKQTLTPEMKAQKMTDRMTQELNLSQDQIVKVKAINLQIAQKRAEMQTTNQGSKEDLSAYKAELQKVLTPEQLQKLEDLQQEQKAKRASNMQEHNATPQQIKQ